MCRLLRTSLLTLPLLTLLGCEASAPPVETGPPVTPEALCSQLAAIVCDASESCCEVAGAAPGCEADQELRCMESLGAMVADPRVGYVPERAGFLLAQVRERATGCFHESFDLADLDVIFAGTVPDGGDCSPGAIDGVVRSAELHRAAVACEDFATCRIRLAWDDTPIGTCEPRGMAGDDRCSHPYDCTQGSFCDLPDGWRVGDWGRCLARRADGWACASGFECASGYCGEGACGAPSAHDRCLSIDYPSLVLEDGPILYQRLDEEGDTATDASGRANHASYEGMIARTETGALEDDGAIEFDGTSGYLAVSSVQGMGSEALTIELWIAVPEGGGGPLVALEGSRNSLVMDIDANAFRGRFIEPGALPEDPDMVVEVATDPGALGAGFHHVALVYDGEGSRIFIDGALQAELAGTQRLPTSPSLTIGARVTADATTYFTGAIDEVALFPTALDEATFALRVDVATAGPIENDFVLFGWAR